MKEKNFAEGHQKKANMVRSKELKSPDLIEVEAKNKYSKEQAVSMLHLAAIAHVLFPENFPKPEAVRRAEEDGYSVVFEYIPHDDFHSKLNASRVENDGSYSESLNDEVVAYDKRIDKDQFLKKIDSAGLLFASEDVNPLNVIVQGGKSIYLDMQPAFAGYERNYVLNFRPQQLKDYINTCGANVKAICQTHLDKIYECLPRELKDMYPDKFKL